jgi:hypothetical protein
MHPRAAYLAGRLAGIPEDLRATLIEALDSCEREEREQHAKYSRFGLKGSARHKKAAKRFAAARKQLEAMAPTPQPTLKENENV